MFRRFTSTSAAVTSVVAATLLGTLTVSPALSAPLPSTDSRSAAEPAAAGNCYDYTYKEGVKSVYYVDNSPIDCAGRRTAITLAVYELDPAPESLPKAGPLPDKQAESLRVKYASQFNVACTNAAKEFLGRDTGISRFNVNSLFDVDADGHVVGRCDLLLASHTPDKLDVIPQNVEQVADNRTYTNCVIERGGTWLSYRKCSSRTYAGRHAGWLNAKQNSNFPGMKVVERKAQNACKKHSFGAPFYFKYPGTRTMWILGGRYSCFYQDSAVP